MTRRRDLPRAFDEAEGVSSSLAGDWLFPTSPFLGFPIFRVAHFYPGNVVPEALCGPQPRLAQGLLSFGHEIPEGMFTWEPAGDRPRCRRCEAALARLDSSAAPGEPTSALRPRSL
jgi:hypothetical protein